MPVKIQENIPLAPLTVYKIGGSARYFFEAKNSEDLEEATTWARERGCPLFVLGAGSNVLVSDGGYNGLIIRLSSGGVRADAENLVADAGVMMARAVNESARAGLAGFEWGIGIPGTIGGSVRGNAGCFGGEMKDVIESVEIFDTLNAKRSTLNPKQCEFGYRDSIFKKHPEWIILSATLKLKKGDGDEIRNKIKEITFARTQKQDIGTKSCGCIFKNISWERQDIDKKSLLERFPELGQFMRYPNIPASYLIDASGLKGRRVGNVFVSPKHANYFVNDGGASARDAADLINQAKDAVKEKFGIILEEEIQYAGFDSIGN